MPVGIFVPARAEDLSLSFASGVDSAAQGAILYRNASSRYAALAAGTSGYQLTAQGAGADPLWVAPATTLSGDVTLAPASSTRNLIVNQSADIMGLRVRGHATQTTDILQIENSAGFGLMMCSPLVLCQTQSPSGTVTAFQAVDDLGNIRFFVFSNGTSFWNAVTATASLTSNNSPTFNIRSSRWTGTAEAVEGHAVQVTRLDSGANRTVMQFKDNGGTTNLAIAGTGGQVSVGFTTPASATLASLGQFHVRSQATGTPTATFRAISGQSVDILQAQDSAAVLLASVSQIGALLVRPLDAATNSVTTGFTLGHATSGTPAAGFGSRSLYTLSSSTTANTSAMQQETSWVVATHASRTARTVWSTFDTSAREAIRIEASGSAAMIGFLGAAAVARPTAYTQTYATATRTHANPTSADLTGITSSTTGTALAEPSAAYTQAEMQQNFRRIQDQFNALRADVLNNKQVINSIIDDQQSNGLFG